ncbi:MAG: DNA gyrase C-terminal beta-propeller domain-containing protein [Acidimicrobiales bacterium]
MSLKGNAKVLGAGIADERTVIVTVSDTGSGKSTATEGVPQKGRGTSGVRLTKFKDEQRLDYAWIGTPDRIVAVVGQADSPTRPENTPESFAMRPTRRDGASTMLATRALSPDLRW